MKTLRIFISSPGDVTEERDRARQVIESLRRRYAGVFQLKPVLWEDLPLQADMSFQQGIDLVLSAEHGIDIAVFILWSRLGSPLGAMIRKEDGGEYRSGTEREFDLMMRARQQSVGQRPAIFVYTRKDETSFDERLRGKPTSEKEQDIRQKKLVEQFIAEEFHDIRTGQSTRAYHSFDRPVTFSQRLRAHLIELLDEHAGGGAAEHVWDVEKDGPPFLGLEAFQPRHANVFFGRELETLEARHALREQARQGCAFLLLSGASGSGKSSLARAGVLPAVVENELDDTLTRWLALIVTPQELGSDPLTDLLTRLSAPDLLPELRGESDGLDSCIAMFKAHEKHGLKRLLDDVFARASRRQQGGVRLLLLLDQLEELFASTAVSAEQRDALLCTIETMARSGHVWVLATVRSDFSGAVLSQPVLARMCQGGGLLPVLPPETDALRRMITEPARLAGLSYETTGAENLADRILRDATGHAELLPLLEFVLEKLFTKRTAQGVLPRSEYEALGGVEGALAKRADEVFASLPSAAQAALSPVLHRLASIGADTGQSTSGEHLVRRSAPVAALRAMANAGPLLDAFVKERLFITRSEKDKDGVPQPAVLTLAHESLMRVWSRAVQWKNDNLDLLLTRARVAARLKENSPLLESDPLLDSAVHHLAAMPEGFSTEEQHFIQASQQTAAQNKQRRERLRRRVTLALSALTLLSLLSAGWAWIQQQEAQTQARRAGDALHGNEQMLREAAISMHTRALAEFDEGHWHEAMALLARALRYDPDDYPSAATAGWAIVQGIDRLIESPAATLAKAKADASTPSISALSFSRDKRSDRALVWDEERRTLQLWRLSSRQPDGPVITLPWVPDEAALSFQGAYVLLLREIDGQCEATAWNLLNGSALASPIIFPTSQSARTIDPGFKEGGWYVGEYLAGTLRHIVVDQNELRVNYAIERFESFSPRCLSPDGSLLVEVADAPKRPTDRPNFDKIFKVFDASTGAKTAFLETAGAWLWDAKHLSFSADGRMMAAGSSVWDKHGLAHVWNPRAGESWGMIEHGATLEAIRLSPDGRRLLTVGGNKLKAWELKDRTPVLLWEKQVQSSGMGLEAGAEPENLQFTPDGGKVIIRSGFSETFLVYLTSDGESVFGDGIKGSNLAISPDGTSMAVSLRKKVRFYDLITFDELSGTFECDSDPASLRYAPDGISIAVTLRDGTTQAWPVSTQTHHFIPLRTARFGDFAFNETTNRLLFRPWKNDAEHPVSIWDLKRFVQTGVIDDPKTSHACWIPGIDGLLASGENGNRRLLATADGTYQPAQTLADHETAFNVSPSGRHSVHETERGTLAVTTLSDGKVVATTKVPLKDYQRISSFTFSALDESIVFIAIQYGDGDFIWPWQTHVPPILCSEKGTLSGQSDSGRLVVQSGDRLQILSTGSAAETPPQESFLPGTQNGNVIAWTLLQHRKELATFGLQDGLKIWSLDTQAPSLKAEMPLATSPFARNDFGNVKLLFGDGTDRLVFEPKSQAFFALTDSHVLALDAVERHLRRPFRYGGKEEASGLKMQMGPDDTCVLWGYLSDRVQLLDTKSMRQLAPNISFPAGTQLMDVTVSPDQQWIAVSSSAIKEARLYPFLQIPRGKCPAWVASLCELAGGIRIDEHNDKTSLSVKERKAIKDALLKELDRHPPEQRDEWHVLLSWVLQAGSDDGIVPGHAVTQEFLTQRDLGEQSVRSLLAVLRASPLESMNRLVLAALIDQGNPTEADLAAYLRWFDLKMIETQASESDAAVAWTLWNMAAEWLLLKPRSSIWGPGSDITCAAGAIDACTRALKLERDAASDQRPVSDAVTLGMAVAAWNAGRRDEALAFYQSLLDADRSWTQPEKIDGLDWPPEQRAQLDAVIKAVLEKQPQLRN